VQIKIYSSVKPELVPAIIDEAHKNGLRVSGHIPAEMTAAQCVELGYDEIQHINFLILNFFPEVKNTNTIARLIEPAKRGAGLDLTSPQVRPSSSCCRITTPSSISRSASSKIHISAAPAKSPAASSPSPTACRRKFAAVCFPRA
jgi:hypothetical protein